MLTKTVELCEASGILVGTMTLSDAEKLDMLVRKSMLSGFDAAKGLLDQGYDFEEMRSMLVDDLGLATNV